MALNYRRPRGTADALPEQSSRFDSVEKVFFEQARLNGFGRIRIPTFEYTEVFARSSGDTSDVVSKEMYSFTDRGGDGLTLLPEGTAGVVRAFLENGLSGGSLPEKLFYLTPCFRYNRPQAGRLREFHQFGFEIFGASSMLAEAELILLANKGFAQLGLSDAVITKINSIGCKTCRGEYKAALVSYFNKHLDVLCDTCKERLEKNPMRILDCKSEECKAICADAPLMTDYLCDDCRSHYDGLCEILDGLGVKYERDPMIVRGLDYYNGPVFEFVTDKLGSQSAIGAGGRYDGLVEEFGGQHTPALGMGLGVERICLLAEKCGFAFPEREAPLLFIIPMGEDTKLRAAQLADELRSKGIPCLAELAERSLKAAMRYADKSGARFTLVLGTDELTAGKFTVKDMKNSDSFVTDAEGLADEITSR